MIAGFAGPGLAGWQTGSGRFWSGGLCRRLEVGTEIGDGFAEVLRDLLCAGASNIPAREPPTDRLSADAQLFRHFILVPVKPLVQLVEGRLAGFLVLLGLGWHSVVNLLSRGSCRCMTVV